MPFLQLCVSIHSHRLWTSICNLSHRRRRLLLDISVNFHSPRADARSLRIHLQSRRRSWGILCVNAVHPSRLLSSSHLLLFFFFLNPALQPSLARQPVLCLFRVSLRAYVCAKESRMLPRRMCSTVISQKSNNAPSRSVSLTPHPHSPKIICFIHSVHYQHTRSTVRKRSQPSHVDTSRHSSSHHLSCLPVSPPFPACLHPNLSVRKHRCTLSRTTSRSMRDIQPPIKISVFARSTGGTCLSAIPCLTLLIPHTCVTQPHAPRALCPGRRRWFSTHASFPSPPCISANKPQLCYMDPLIGYVCMLRSLG